MTTKAEAHRKKWGWEAYKIGETIEEAGILIMSEPIELGPEMRNTHYDVRYTCCDLDARMSHEKIRERARKQSTRCRSCGHKRTAEVRRIEREQAGLSRTERLPPPLYGVVMPTWPVPRYVTRGRTLYCDAGAQPQAGIDWMACFSPSMAQVLRETHNTTHRVRTYAQHETL